MDGHFSKRIETEYQSIAEELIRWYIRSQRALPWREDTDPYRVWISEIMLQQTRVEAVVDYFHRFMDLFPTVGILADAEEQAVLKAWEGLGYYSRARNLHRAAKEIMTRYSGVFPGTLKGILSLPGIGPYTAGAIASIAYDLPTPAVDGNVLRVVARLDGIDADVLLSATKKDVTERVQAMYIPGRANPLTQGLMELGALICVPGSPKCDICPVSGYCRAYQTGKQEYLPVRSPRKKQRVSTLCAGLIRCEGGMLIAKRPEKGMLANLWEFPLVERGRSKREIIASFKDTYGVVIESLEKVGHVRHVFTHRIWEVDVYRARGTTVSDRCRAVPLAELDTYPMPTVFQKMKEWV
jgi:A/G-specific adenine glycosylase